MELEAHEAVFCCDEGDTNAIGGGTAGDHEGKGQGDKSEDPTKKRGWKNGEGDGVRNNEATENVDKDAIAEPADVITDEEGD